MQHIAFMDLYEVENLVTFSTRKFFVSPCYNFLCVIQRYG